MTLPPQNKMSLPLRVLLIASSIWLASLPVGTQADTTFRPRVSPTEGDQDRQTAAACYAHARLLELQGQRAAALRRYQRAWRYDSQATSILKYVVPLAQSVNRPHEAARYAILAAEQSPDNAELLIQLGLYLIERGDTSRAISLFEQARRLRMDSPPDSELVALHIELGRFHLARKDFASSIERFDFVRKALARPGEYGLDEPAVERLLAQQVLLFAVMGEAYLQAGDSETAAKLFMEAYSDQNDTAVLSFHLARIAKEQGQAKLAAERLEAYLEAKQSSQGTAPYELLHALSMQQQPDPASARQATLEKLRKWHAEDPNNSPLRYSLAQRLFEHEKFAEAGEHYLELLEAAPASVAYQRLAEIADRTADAGLLLRVAAIAMSETDSIDALRTDGELLAGGELLTAAAELGKRRAAEEVNAPGEPVAAAAALLASEIDDLPAVRALLATSLARQEQAADTVREAVGLSLFTRGHYTFAADVFRAAVRKEDGSEQAQFYYYLSGALEMASQTDQALLAAEAGSALRPDVAAFQLRPAWVLYHAKRYEQAEARYLAILKRYDAEHDLASRKTARDIRYVLSNISSSQNDFARAEEWLEQILDEFPRDSGALNDLGYLWADRGEHLQRALRMVGSAVDSDPENVAYRDSLGWAYYRLARFEDAVRELELAAQGVGVDGVILEHLGDAYHGAGRGDKARETWRRAVHAFSDAKDTEAVRRVTLKIENQLLQ